ncbi:flagellar filament capping protein FliD [Methylotuvimicrobium alcaliphilum]|uniref:Flagellar hook-associated protein 2 n=1 Tax=Methylotuvimicrobium alcaliphilum (strain DSM 19304 / NCIMB 14124 / VKM B-2133 / 20Z) TaxID=1091494 RepID=G4T1M1_META2|nr:flagellar filament capping protein FliD [Methylotuvimicrobium alcaliphilum]CCE22443.1 Flagellar hook-associated 2 domain protein [Methylotuvimicrobium alcaliphilum 20Z]
MAITSALGLGSGIDINGLVSQLVRAEGQPALNAINRQETSVKSRLSALGTLKSALSGFQAAANKLKDGGLFSKHQAATANDNIATAQASSLAVAGSYSLKVTQLATSHKLITGGVGYSGYDAEIGVGELTLSVGGAAFSVNIDDTNNTLGGIRDTINRAQDNTGVTASIISVDEGYKLVLTAKDTGSANAISMSSTDSGLADLADNMQQQRPALDAIIEVDGQVATRGQNSISDVIQGVTLDLKTADPDTVFDLDVSVDSKAITEAANDFVKAYNSLMSSVKNLGKFDAETQAAGALIGDSTLRMVQSQIRSEISRPVDSANGDLNSLALIGITIDRNGVMSLDNSKFSEILDGNLGAISDVFSSDQGIANRLSERLDQYLKTGGVLDSRTKSLSQQLKGFETRRENVQVRLDNLESALLKQFIAMDTAVGQFQATGSFVAQQLALLNS